MALGPTPWFGVRDPHSSSCSAFWEILSRPPLLFIELVILEAPTRALIWRPRMGQESGLSASVLKSDVTKCLWGKDFVVILAASFLLSRPKISILGKSVEINFPLPPSALPSPLPGLHAPSLHRTSGGWSLSRAPAIWQLKVLSLEDARLISRSQMWWMLLFWKDTKCLISARGWYFGGTLAASYLKYTCAFLPSQKPFQTTVSPSTWESASSIVIAQFGLVIAVVVFYYCCGYY